MITDLQEPDGEVGAVDCRIDIRESLANQGATGEVAEVSIPAERITRLPAFMVDVDPGYLRPENSAFAPDDDPRAFLRKIRPALARHPILRDAEVRSTGSGLHLIVRLEPAVELMTAADQSRWATLVRLVQSSIPSDPNAPGITGLTRPVGSINSKTGRPVECLEIGRPVEPGRVVQFAKDLAAAPFRTVAGVLVGGGPATTCPVCRDPASRLGTADHSGRCYRCGPVDLGKLFGAFYATSIPGGHPPAGVDRPHSAAEGGTGLAADLLIAVPGPHVVRSTPLPLQDITMPTTINPARMQAKNLLKALTAYRIGPAAVRSRTVIHGLDNRGVCLGTSIDTVLANAADALVATGRAYRYENSLVFENPRGRGSLNTLAVGGVAESQAAPILSNVLVASVERGGMPSESLLPPRIVAALLADEGLAPRLPEIHYYARRPTFDLNFVLCDRGWNPGSGILMHAEAVDVEVPKVFPGGQRLEATDRPAASPSACRDVVERLPRHLRELLRESTWRSDADLVNSVAVLLTGLLINHFLDDPHPAVVVDANQSGLGKTLLVSLFGIVLDGVVPPQIRLGDENEVEKRLCSELIALRTSVFFFDNVRDEIRSPLLEQNILAPSLSIRILGRSETITRPNNYLWAITSNSTKGTSDLISRGVPIRLYHLGDPKPRRFERDPAEYAKSNRAEILAELAGMVSLWVERGRPSGRHRHRCARWAATIGGILEVAGLGKEFLANVADAEAEMDEGLRALVALAETVFEKGTSTDAFGRGRDGREPMGLPAAAWLPLATPAGILRDRLAAATSDRARHTILGTFLANGVDRRVPIETPAGKLWATLRRREARAHARHYHFEFTEFEPASESPSTPERGLPPHGEADSPVVEPASLDGSLATTATTAGEPPPWLAGPVNDPSPVDPTWV